MPFVSISRKPISTVKELLGYLNQLPGDTPVTNQYGEETDITIYYSQGKPFVEFQ